MKSFWRCLFFWQFYAAGVVQSLSLHNWTLSAIKLPARNDRMACGYHSTSHSVFLLGGTRDNRALYQLNLTNKQFITHNSVSTDLTFRGEGYVQHSNSIYAIHNHQIGVLNMNTATFEFPISTKQTISEGERLCICISNDGRYLLLLGGSTTSNYQNKHNKFEIYDIENDSLIIGPNMNTIRSGHTCIVDNNNYLYAIGGDKEIELNVNEYINSIERIYIGNINNIQSESWQNITHGMNEKKNGLRSVILNDNIYIFGGEMNSGLKVKTVEIIYNTNRNKIYFDNPLLYAMYQGCVVVINDEIYYFGGVNDNSNNVQHIQIAKIITTSPTINPSIIPTINPSENPTENPTYIPTISPTMSPTYIPTNSPILDLMVNDITQVQTTLNNYGRSKKKNEIDMNIIYIGISVVIVLICFVFIFRWYFKKKRGEKSTTLEMMSYSEKERQIMDGENAKNKSNIETNGNHLMEDLNCNTTGVVKNDEKLSDDDESLYVVADNVTSGSGNTPQNIDEQQTQTNDMTYTNGTV
eukprot:506189_1